MHSSHFIKALKLIIIVLFPLLSYSEDIDKLKRFAHELMQQGEYYRAITEFLRINSYYPDNPEHLINLMNVASCYYLGGDKLKSLEFQHQILKNDSLNWAVQWQIARINYEISRYFQSNQFIESQLKKVDSAQKDSLLVLSALNYVNLYQFQSARSRLNQIRFKSPLKTTANQFLGVLDSNLPLKRKSRTKAIVFNTLLPGSGYCYAKRYQTGVTAFLTNLFFGYVSYVSFRDDNQGLGLLSGFCFLTFYFGSTYGSIQSVNQYNREVFVDLKNQLIF